VRAAGVGEQGSAAVWLLLMLPALVLSAGIVVDGGKALQARQQATGLAGEGARAAVDRMDTSAYRDSTGPFVPAPGAVQAAACTWVAQARPDASCQARPGAGGVVDVTVTLTYTPVLLAPIGPRSATGHGTARPAVGVQREVTSP
jgi:Flp pilus assembly protein TadG